MSLTIAVVAAGAMGSGVGATLAGNGAKVLTSFTGRSEATIGRARAAGMQPASDRELAEADIFLSIVPPDQAVTLGAWFADQIRAAGTTPLYVDFNAVNPATARQVADTVSAAGARFVDGSIVGPPPRPDSSRTTFYVSGRHAGEAVRLGEHGLQIKVLDGDTGAASALKMTYAGLSKGFTALGTAMILAARREGAGDALAAELAISQPEMLARLSRSVPDMLPKAYRFVPEMQQIAGFLGADDPASAIYEAIAGLYQQVADDHDRHGPLGTTLKDFVKKRP